MIKIDFLSSELINLLLSVQYACNYDDMMEELRDLGIDPDQDIIDAYNCISNCIDFNTIGLQLFFQNNSFNECFMFAIYENKINELKAPEDLFSYLRVVSREYLKHSMLSFFDENNQKEDCYTKLINDGNLLINFIFNLNINDKIKWQVIDFIKDPEKYILSVISLMEDIKCKIKHTYRSNQDKWECHIRKFEKKIVQNSNFFSNEELHMLQEHFNTDKYNNIIILPSFVNEILLKSIPIENTLYLILGVNYEKAIGLYNSEPECIDSLKVIKVLSDEYRLRIIKMLRGRTLCASKIAQNLNLSRSAVSYHLLELSQMGIITSKKEGKQRFYCTNQKMLNMIVNILTDMLYKDD